jgi:2-amino-4-hydroxy-6-hydroxymethyldihydropteridine diphosphokinase
MLKGCKVLCKSRIFETAPMGGPAQGSFLNAAIIVDTVLNPAELLQAFLRIENELGRVRIQKNGPRTIDLDIIFYGRNVQSESHLHIPHPRFMERGFVLLPLCDIIPDFVDPLTGKRITRLLEELGDTADRIGVDKGPL